MPADLVLRSPQEPVRRHGQHQEAAGPQHAHRLGQRAGVIRNVFQNVEHGYEVEGLGSIRKSGGGSLGDRREAALAAVAGRLVVHVHTKSAPMATQMEEHRAGAAADVKDQPGPGWGLREVILQETQDDAPPTKEPPVAVFDLDVFAVELALQVSFWRA